MLVTVTFCGTFELQAILLRIVLPTGAGLQLNDLQHPLHNQAHSEEDKEHG